MMKNPIQIWIGRKCFEEAKPKKHNSRFLKVNFPKNLYFSERSFLSNFLYTYDISTTYFAMMLNNTFRNSRHFKIHLFMSVTSFILTTSIICLIEFSFTN